MVFARTHLQRSRETALQKAKGVIRICLVGDSNTRGYPATAPTYNYRIAFWFSSRAASLDIDLVGPNSRTDGYAIDPEFYGVGGGQMSLLLDGVATIQSFEPEIVFVMLGTNDSINGVDQATSIDIAKQSIRALDPIPLIFTTIPPMTDGPSNTNRNLLNPLILSELDGYGKTSVVDVGSLMTTDQMLDGVHFDEAGFENLGKEIYKALTEIIQSRGIVRRTLPTSILSSGLNGTAVLPLFTFSAGSTWTITSGALDCTVNSPSLPLSYALYYMDRYAQFEVTSRILSPPDANTLRGQIINFVSDDTYHAILINSTTLYIRRYVDGTPTDIFSVGYTKSGLATEKLTVQYAGNRLRVLLNAVEVYNQDHNVDPGQNAIGLATNNSGLFDNLIINALT